MCFSRSTTIRIYFTKRARQHRGACGDRRFLLVYVLLAQRFGTMISVLGAVGVWFVAALPLRSAEWSFLPVAGMNLAIFAVAIALTSKLSKCADAAGQTALV